MKPLRIISILILSLSTLTSAAQMGLRSFKVKQEGKAVFNPHWYAQAQMGASYTPSHISAGDLISPAMGAYGGYQFSPLFGLRTGLTGWKAKGAIGNPESVYKYSYLQGNLDATFNLCELFRKYNPKHFFHTYMFMGIGFNAAFNNDEAITLSNSGYLLDNLWYKRKASFVGRGGLGVNFRLTNKLFLNVEANANMLSEQYNSQNSGNVDWQFNTLVGVTYHFGQPFKKTKPTYYKSEPVRKDSLKHKKAKE